MREMRRMIRVLGIVVCLSGVALGGPILDLNDLAKLYSAGMDPSLSGLVGNQTWLSVRYYHQGPSESRYDAGIHNLVIMERNSSPADIRLQGFCLESPMWWPSSPGDAQYGGPYRVEELQHSQSMTYATPHEPGDLLFLGEEKAAQLTHMFDRYWDADIGAVDAIGVQLAAWKVVHEDRVRIIHGWPEEPEWFTRYLECHAFALGISAADGIVPGYAALTNHDWQDFVVRTIPRAPTVVPVPGVFGLSLFGLAGVGWLRRRRYL